jgi:hypothetical protein
MVALSETFVQSSNRVEQLRRRNLRIAIRQLERAELYLVAVDSLELDDEGTEEGIEDLLRLLRGLQHHLVRLRASA